MSLSSAIVILNGQVLPEPEGTKFWKESGVKLGWGLFETLRATRGQVEFLALHHERLARSCEKLHLAAPSLEDFAEQLEHALAKVTSPLARLRWTTLSSAPQKPPTYHVIEAEPFTAYASEATLQLLPYPTPSQGPLVGHKTLSYGAHAWGLQYAKMQGADEGLWLNDQNQLTEGCTSNLFWFKSGTLYTPSLATGCLPGVTRHVVLGLARQQQWQVEETEATLEDLRSADEVFLTSSLRGIQPVKSFIAQGSKITWEKSHSSSAIKHLFEQLIESQCVAQTKISCTKSSYFASQAPAEHV